MGLNYFSDYGSSSSSESCSTWGLKETWENFQSDLQNDTVIRPRCSSLSEVLPESCSLDARMKEFRMNGFDSPYDPEEEIKSARRNPYSGMGPAGGYLRQKSWPEPEKTPLMPLPQADWKKLRATETLSARQAEATESQVITANPWNAITTEQMHVLNSVPSNVLYALLRDLEEIHGQRYLKPKRRMQEQECRFCKNNGERESFYRSHVLRARGRVACPVLRALQCPRCGASGDTAHTIKYCPRATPAERKQSAAMMKSLRMASGRRRNFVAPSSDIEDEYIRFGEKSPILTSDVAEHNYVSAPLDPIWEALEKKLMF